MNHLQYARSFLFVPANRPERFNKAHSSGAHAVIIDLEDAVAPVDKVGARDACRDYLNMGGSVLLRINALDTEWAHDDLQLCGLPGVQGVVLPKVEGAAPLVEVVRRAGLGTAILPLIETAAGMMNVHEIARAQGVLRLLFGTVDFCADLGIEGDFDELASYRAALVLASRVADLQAPVDGVTLALNDEQALASSVLRAKRVGFGGKLCIHPAQIAMVNRCFQPSTDQVEWATQVLRKAELNAGAFEFQGKMVDEPVLAQARRVLASRTAPVSVS